MSITRAWKVYGSDGHRQRISFFPSFCHDFSKNGETRIIETLCSDALNTNDYVIVSITMNTFEECEKELGGQLSDGIFENSYYGKVEEIKLGE